MSSFAADPGSARTTWLIILLTMTPLFGTLTPAWAQESDSSLYAVSLSQSDWAAFEEGVAAVESNRYADALTVLSPLAVREPIAYHPEHGSSVTWFGRALYARDLHYQARRTWLRGIRRAEATGHTAVGAAEALIQSMSADSIRLNPRTATFAFTHILNALDRRVSASEKSVLRRHADRLSLIAPDSLSSALAAFARKDTSLIGTSVAPSLRRWFDAQDPVLATDRNERLSEHVARVRSAEEQYAWSKRASGLDDRGEVLVQYGRPDKSMSVTREPGRKHMLPSTGNTTPDVRTALRELYLSPSMFPVENEVWTYYDLEDVSHFVFVRSQKPGHPYLKGTARDLLPQSLHVPPARGPTIGSSMPEWMGYFTLYTELYRQLQRADARYGDRYHEFLNYDSRSDGPPTVFVMSQMAQNEIENHRIRREQENAPNQESQVFAAHSSLRLAVRTARFLEPNGSTRTEVYWGAATKALKVSSKWMDNALRLGFDLSGDFLVRTTGELRTGMLHPVDRKMRVDTITSRQWRNQDRLPPRTLVLSGDADEYQLDVEWIQRTIDPQNQSGPVAHTTRRKKTLPALSSDPSQLEMSDVVPLSVPEEGPSLPTNNREARSRVIPHDTVAAGQSLAFAFEIYHLTFGPGDRTKYTVEYEVSTEEERKGLAGVLGMTEPSRTATASTYQGSSRRTTEYILLELNESFNLPKEAPVTITVHVTDEVSGQTVSRPVSFTLVSEDSG